MFMSECFLSCRCKFLEYSFSYFVYFMSLCFVCASMLYFIYFLFLFAYSHTFKFYLFVSLCLLFPFLFSLLIPFFYIPVLHFPLFFRSLSPLHFLYHCPHFPVLSSLFLFSSLSSPRTELGQESVPSSTHNATVVVSAAGVPYLQARAGEQNTALSLSTTPSASSSSSSSASSDRQPAPPGIMASSHPQGQSYSLGISNSGLGPPPPNPPGGVFTSTGQHNSSDGCSLANMVSAANADPHTDTSSRQFLHPTLS